MFTFKQYVDQRIRSLKEDQSQQLSVGDTVRHKEYADELGDGVIVFSYPSEDLYDVKWNNPNGRWMGKSSRYNGYKLELVKKGSSPTTQQPAPEQNQQPTYYSEPPPASPPPKVQEFEKDDRVVHKDYPEMGTGVILRVGSGIGHMKSYQVKWSTGHKSTVEAYKLQLAYR